MQERFTRYFEKSSDNTRNISRLYTIARNGFLDHKRKADRHVEFQQVHEPRPADMTEAIEVKQAYTQILSAMEQLDEDEREILALVLSGDFNYEEIASRVAISLPIPLAAAGPLTPAFDSISFRPMQGYYFQRIPTRTLLKNP